MASGNLTERMPELTPYQMESTYAAAMTSLTISVNSLLDRLGLAMNDILHIANSVTIASKEASQGSDHLSNRTQQMAASLEQTAASMQEMTSSVDNNTNAAKQANQLASDSRKQSDIVSEITHASEEQACGISQVNKAISSLDDVTQQNAALVEETAAAAGALNDQAVQLRDAISYFRTAETADIEQETSQTFEDFQRQQATQSVVKLNDEWTSF